MKKVFESTIGATATAMFERLGRRRNPPCRARQALRLRDGDVGLELVVHDDQLHVAPAELASQILDGKLKSVSRLLAEDGRGAGQGQQQPDPQLVLRLGLEAAAECGGKREDKVDFFIVCSPSLLSLCVIFVSFGIEIGRSEG